VWILTIIYFGVLFVHAYAFNVVTWAQLVALGKSTLFGLKGIRTVPNAAPTPLPASLSVPMCYTRPRGITLVQYIAMAAEGYLSEERALALRRVYLTNVSVQDASPCTGRIECPIRKFAIREPLVTVYAIRGTATVKDAVTYMELLASAFLYEVGAVFHPLFDTCGDFSKYAYKFALNLAVFAFPHFFFVDKYVSSISDYIVKDGAPANAIVVGHSLGGSLSKLVALRTGLVSISVSGTGISGVTGVIAGETDMTRLMSFLDILPEQDLLSSFDSSGAAIYRVPCNTGIADCHNVSRTLCTMDYICRGEFSEYCTTAFSEEQRVQIKSLWSLEGKRLAKDPVHH
jgi:pimeloyl-ACP methyl ester carboxylesterase